MIRESDLRQLRRERYGWTREILGTAEPERAYDVLPELVSEPYRRIVDRGLSTDDDIDVLHDVFPNNVLHVNFVGDTLEVAEGIIFETRQDARWHHRAVTLSPGLDETMPQEVDYELSTKDEILTVKKESAGGSCIRP